MNIDHVVLWVSNQERSLDFFVNVVGLEPVRAREFAEGSVGFPSVRLSEMTILDLMDKNKASSVREFTGGAGLTIPEVTYEPGCGPGIAWLVVT